MINPLTFEWKKENYVAISGIVDEKSDFSELFLKKFQVLFIDLKKISRMNSSGVRNWVIALNKLKEVEIHYINCSFAVVDQLSMVPEFLTKKTFVESFDARYVCESCNSSYIFTLIVGFDIEPGLSQYLDGPEKFCSNCKAKLEFDHNPDSYLYFLSNLKNTKK